MQMPTMQAAGRRGLGVGCRMGRRARPCGAMRLSTSAARTPPQGYNATVLAYGQTGSGKTHTMTGGVGIHGVQEQGACSCAQRPAQPGKPIPLHAKSSCLVRRPTSCCLMCQGCVGGGAPRS